MRLQAEPEQDSYFSVYGEPDSPRERKAIEEEIDRDGCWTVRAQVSEADDWRTVDSVSMCVYANPLDPFQNCHVVDLMRAALDSIAVCGEH